MTNTQDRGALVRKLADIAEEAGRIISNIYATDFTVHQKGPNDPVTLADQQANTVICAALEQEYPGLPLVAEESDSSRYAGFENEPAVFFVDPLDGTNEFVARNGEFVVMIGYAEKGKAVAGVVHAPTRDLTWMGAPGWGAFERNHAGHYRPISVSSVASLSQMRVVVSRSHRTAALDAYLSHVKPGEVRSLGSAGLKSTAVAYGAADAYIQLGFAGKLWDTCAPEAIVIAAGGQYTDQKGNAITYSRSELAQTQGVIASNGVLHSELLAQGI